MARIVPSTMASIILKRGIVRWRLAQLRVPIGKRSGLHSPLYQKFHVQWWQCLVCHHIFLVHLLNNCIIPSRLYTVVPWQPYTSVQDQWRTIGSVNSYQDWWDEQAGSASGLHAMNILRVPLIVNTLLGHSPGATTSLHDRPRPLEGYRVLDVGCGAGILSEVCVHFDPICSCTFSP